MISLRAHCAPAARKRKPRAKRQHHGRMSMIDRKNEAVAKARKM